MSKKLLEITRKVVQKAKRPVASVGNNLLIYKKNIGWVQEGGFYANRIMNMMESAPSDILRPLKIRFTVPIMQTSYSRYWLWEYDENIFDGEWRDINLKPEEAIFETCKVNFKTGEISMIHFMANPIYGPIISMPYDPDALDEEWEELVKKAFPDIAIRQYVQEAFSLLLLPHHFTKSLYLLIGPSNTGKSTFAAAVATAAGGIIGQVSCNPDAAAARAFDSYPLVGKFCAISEELEQLSLKGKAWLKAYTGGQFSWEVKFGERSSSAPTAKFIGISNQLPDFVEDSKAIYNRMIAIPMNEVVQGTLNEDMCTANYWAVPKRRKGVLGWMIRGLDRLAKKDFQLESPSSLIVLKKEIRTSTHPTLRWLAANIEAVDDPEARIVTSDILDRLARNKIVSTDRKLKELLKELFPNIKENKRCRGKKGNFKNGRGFSGIRFYE